MKRSPPKLPLRFFHWYCHPKFLKYIEGFDGIVWGAGGTQGINPSKLLWKTCKTKPCFTTLPNPKMYCNRWVEVKAWSWRRGDCSPLSSGLSEKKVSGIWSNTINNRIFDGV